MSWVAQMKRSLFTPPDEFAALPLLALLPPAGSVSELPSFTSSLYARYEQVHQMRQNFEQQGGEPVPERVRNEEEMLKIVLEWLAVNIPQ